MNGHHQKRAVTLLTGDACQVLRGMPTGSADCVVTSPPYLGLRDYGEPGQYGLEASPQEYARSLRGVFRGIRRVLTPDGTVWLNLGDRYSGGTYGSYDVNGGKARGRVLTTQRRPCGLPGKNLLGIPWLVVFALQQDGWLLRNAIIWHKPNAMPESVRDRMACRYEMIFLLARQRRHWFNPTALTGRTGNHHVPLDVPPVRQSPCRQTARQSCRNPPELHARPPRQQRHDRGSCQTASRCRCTKPLPQVCRSSC